MLDAVNLVKNLEDEGQLGLELAFVVVLFPFQLAQMALGEKNAFLDVALGVF